MSIPPRCAPRVLADREHPRGDVGGRRDNGDTFLEPESYELPTPDAVDLVVEMADVMAAFAAQRLARIDAMRREALRDAERDGVALTEIVDRSIRLELAAALRITEHRAGELLRRAEALVHRYPRVLTSLERADITEQHADILVDALDGLEPPVAARVLPEGIELARTQPVGTFRRMLRTLIDTVRSATLTERHEAALTRRRVAVEAADDGMAWLHAFVPAVEARAALDRATAMAKALKDVDGETRTLDQLRADVICDLVVEGEARSHPRATRGIRATVVTTVPALALLEADDAARDAAGLAPATVEGVGPIPLSRAKELCGGEDGWMRILTHPETGMVLSVGRTKYRAPESLRRLARWRAGRCMGPGCGVPADRCVIDHTIAFADGGETSLHNHAPLCRGHHTVKHHGRWDVRQVPGSGGAVQLTSPTGRRYVVQPERPMPAFRPSDAGDAPF